MILAYSSVVLRTGMSSRRSMQSCRSLDARGCSCNGTVPCRARSDSMMVHFTWACSVFGVWARLRGRIWRRTPINSRQVQRRSVRRSWSWSNALRMPSPSNAAWTPGVGRSVGALQLVLGTSYGFGAVLSTAQGGVLGGLQAHAREDP